MARVLLCWIGHADLKAASGTPEAGLGPIGQAAVALPFEAIHLISDHPRPTTTLYVEWLTGKASAPTIVPHQVKLSGPTAFGEIYERAVEVLGEVNRTHKTGAELTFHLSPGTPAMASVWIILAKTRYPAQLIESSPKHGVGVASVPFDISAEFIPDLLAGADARVRELAAAEAPATPEFADIIHRSRVMTRLVQRARRVAPRNVPVLIEGESGTGKELLARAIHRSSPRRDKPFVAVNCGAIASELVESELFGHEKGAFTDARQRKVGFFEAADGGTMFLDEVGELPRPAQVTMLRVLQEGEVLRVGSTKPVKVDVRVVAATNRTLTDEIGAGRFRDDLFYRLAVAVLKVPPLRERSGDLGPLINHALAQANREASTEPGFVEKGLSAAARNLLVAHLWPGNVRELLNTLRRAVIWSDGATISVDDVREALLPTTSSVRQDTLGRPLGNGLNLQELMKDVARHYLGRAMLEAQGNKTKAAELVGLPSYQTLTNWLTKYEVSS